MDAAASVGAGAIRACGRQSRVAPARRGAPIVFLHGFGADLLLAAGASLAARDAAGAGDRPAWPRISPLGEDASFEALVEAARGALIGEGLGAAHLVGHSLGGVVRGRPVTRCEHEGAVADADRAGRARRRNRHSLLRRLPAGRHRGGSHAVAPYAGHRSRRAGRRARQDHPAPAPRAAAGRRAAAARQGHSPGRPAGDRRARLLASPGADQDRGRAEDASRRPITRTASAASSRCTASRMSATCRISKRAARSQG